MTAVGLTDVGGASGRAMQLRSVQSLRFASPPLGSGSSIGAQDALVTRAPEWTKGSKRRDEYRKQVSAARRIRSRCFATFLP
jgi:hypothetical protein